MPRLSVIRTHNADYVETNVALNTRTSPEAAAVEEPVNARGFLALEHQWAKCIMLENNCSQTEMAWTSLGPWKIVLEMGSSNLDEAILMSTQNKHGK